MLSNLFVPRGVFVNFVALLTHKAVAKRCVFADLYTWFIYNTLYNRLKLAGSSQILAKCMDAQRRTALIFVTQGVGCASCMCDWGIRVKHCNTIRDIDPIFVCWRWPWNKRISGEYNPANTKHLNTICTTSAQCLQRYSNIVQMLYSCFVFTGNLLCLLHVYPWLIDGIKNMTDFVLLFYFKLVFVGTQ